MSRALCLSCAGCLKIRFIFAICFSVYSSPDEQAHPSRSQSFQVQVNHRDTERTETGIPVPLRALCASVVDRGVVEGATWNRREKPRNAHECSERTLGQAGFEPLMGKEFTTKHTKSIAKPYVISNSVVRYQSGVCRWFTSGVWFWGQKRSALSDPGGNSAAPHVSHVGLRFPE